MTTTTTRIDPFEKLGRDVSGATSTEEVLAEAGLDWTVSKRPIAVAGIGEAEEFRATVRDDSEAILGIVKSGYGLVQNAEAFAILEGLVGTDEVQVAHAGELGGGKRVFVQAHYGHELVVDGETLRPYIVLSSSHDGSAGLRVDLTTQRLECTNQLPSIRRTSLGSWTHRHSANVKDAMADAEKVLQRAGDFFGQFKEDVKKLMAKEITDSTFERLLKRAFPADDSMTRRQIGNVEARRDEVRALYTESDRDGAGHHGTAWGVFNAFSSWDLWERPTRGRDIAERQVASVVGGTTTSKVVDFAGHALLEMAN